jgi:mRNA interferase MazF
MIRRNVSRCTGEVTAPCPPGSIHPLREAGRALGMDNQQPLFVTSDDLGPVAPNTIKAAPRLRNVYWCKFPKDMYFPEFWKVRPVVVVSHQNQLNGPVVIVPLTTSPQSNNEWAVNLGRAVHENRDSWAVCNHIYTFSCHRLSAFGGKVPRISEAAFRPIHELILARLPSLDWPRKNT